MLQLLSRSKNAAAIINRLPANSTLTSMATVVRSTRGIIQDLWGCRVERGALGLRVHETPELRSPTLIAAFSGWNDAREVATQAVQFLVRSWGAVRCADLDPEEYFVFSDQRPTVHIVEGSQRKIEWP